MRTRISRRAFAVLAVGAVLAGTGVYGYGGHGSSSSSGTATIFFGQSAAGSGDGSSCANQKAVTFFNTAGNWSTDSSQPIHPGVTVGLCGTVTSQVTFQGDGTAGNPITLQFQSGAKISQTVCPSATGNTTSACLVMSGRNYITVDGNSTGIIESTANGTSPGYANQSQSAGINAQPCNHCEIKYLTIQNIYVKSPPLGQAEISNTGENSIKFSGSDWRIHDNTIHDASWAVWHEGGSGDTNVRVYNNNIYNIDHGFIQSGGNAGVISFHDNHVHDMGNWDNTVNDIHHDGIHCYTAGTGGVAKHIDDFYIYNNRFDGDAGDNATSWVFLEGGTGSSSTPCANSTSRIWIFNNFATYAGSSGTTGFNGVLEDEGPGILRWFNNTQVGIGTSGSSRVCVPGGTTSAFINNVCATGNQVISDASWQDTSSPDYNLYADRGSNAFGCGGGTTVFATWQTCTGSAHDTHSVAVSSALLNSDGTPQNGSPVVGAGTNLTSTCNTMGDTDASDACKKDINGVARSAAGAWNIGAFG